MRFELKPGEYVLWRGRGWRKLVLILGIVFLIIGIFIPVLFLPVGLVLLIIALVSHEYVLTNMRALELGIKGIKREVALGTPGLTVSLVPRRISIGSWGSWWGYSISARYDIIFLANGVEQLRFKGITHGDAHEVAAKLTSLGVKVVSPPSPL
ncbi:MAG: hypothetical protein RQ842_10505 [Vulcanisaeta sp.]|jgi:hypothetical protein|nr:hypothetical protein [Vulcanisaeta sp.]